MFLISKEHAQLLDGFPRVDLRIELDRGRFRSLHPLKVLLETFRLLRQMRAERLEVAIDFQGYGETAFLTWASGCTERWGTVYRPGRRWAYTCAVARNGRVHPADNCLNLLRENGIGNGPVCNDFALPNQYLQAARQFYSAHDLRLDQRTLFIQPTTSDPKKNWPLRGYLEVAKYYKKSGWQVLFGGGPDDRAMLEPARSAGYPVSAGVPILVSAGLAKLSSLVLGGDTGLLHLSVALGKRVVMIMRTLRPGSTHPFQHKEWAIDPGVDTSINSIQTEMVKQRIDEAWNELTNQP